MKITQNSKLQTLIQISQRNIGKSEDRVKIRNIASEEQLEVKIKKNELKKNVNKKTELTKILFVIFQSICFNLNDLIRK